MTSVTGSVSRAPAGHEPVRIALGQTLDVLRYSTGAAIRTENVRKNIVLSSPTNADLRKVAAELTQGCRRTDAMRLFAALCVDFPLPACRRFVSGRTSLPWLFLLAHPGRLDPRPPISDLQSCRILVVLSSDGWQASSLTRATALRLTVRSGENSQAFSLCTRPVPHKGTDTSRCLRYDCTRSALCPMALLSAISRVTCLRCLRFTVITRPGYFMFCLLDDPPTER